MATKKKAAENAAPKKNLLSMIEGIEKDKGIRNIDLRPRDADYLSTGCLALDLIMGGGYFGGRVLQIYGPAGCLADDTFIRYEVRDAKGRRQNHKGGSIENLYRRFHGIPRGGQGYYQRPQTIGSLFYAPSVDDEGIIVKNRVIDVIKSGVKPCIKLTAADKRHVVVTKDHKFWVGDGFVAAGNLVVGSIVYVHNNVFHKKGQKQSKEQSEKRTYVYVKAHPVAAKKKVTEKTTGKAYWYHRLARYRAVVEASMNGLSYDEYISRLNSGDKTMQYLPVELAVHHLDEDFTNDALDNLVVMPRPDHDRLHSAERRLGQREPVPVAITAIEDAGERETYDICMAAPFNNFVANGFVVHNSGKSSLAMMSGKTLQRQKVPTLFRDHEGTTDPKYADALARSIGFDFNDSNGGFFRYSRPKDGVETYDLMLSVLQGMDDCDFGPPQVAFMIDSVATMPTRGEMESWESNKRMAQRAAMHSEWWGRLRTLISKKNASVIAVNQIRANPSPYAPPETRPGGNAWEFSTDNLVKVKKGKPIEVNGEVYQPMKFKTEKNKNFISHQEAEVFLNLGKGIDPASDVLQFLKLIGCLTKVKRAPAIVGLGKDFDGEFKSAASLEEAIREERNEAIKKPELGKETLYGACEALLKSGEALTRYMENKKKKVEGDAEEGEDAATTKASSVTDTDESPEGEDEAEEAPRLGNKKK